MHGNAVRQIDEKKLLRGNGKRFGQLRDEGDARICRSRLDLVEIRPADADHEGKRLLVYPLRLAQMHDVAAQPHGEFFASIVALRKLVFPFGGGHGTSLKWWSSRRVIGRLHQRVKKRIGESFA